MASNIKTVSSNGNGKSGVKVLSASEIFGATPKTLAECEGPMADLARKAAATHKPGLLASAVAAAKAREEEARLAKEREEKKVSKTSANGNSKSAVKAVSGLEELARKGVIVDEASGKVFLALDMTVRETAGMFLLADEYWATLGKTDVPGIGDEVPVVVQVKAGVKKSAIGLSYDREMRPVRSGNTGKKARGK